MAYAVSAGNAVAGASGQAWYADDFNGDSRAVLHRLYRFYLSLYSLRTAPLGACPYVIYLVFRAVRAVFRT